MNPKALSVIGDVACTLILAAAALCLLHAVYMACISGAIARAVR